MRVYLSSPYSQMVVSAYPQDRMASHRLFSRRMAEGLVGGEGFAVDASLIKADANRQRCVPGDEGLPPEAASRAIDEYLAVLDAAAFGGVHRCAEVPLVGGSCRALDWR